jgi:glyoxylate reductase
MMTATIPVMGDGLPDALRKLLGCEIEVLEWDDSPNSPALAKAVGIITYGHPKVDGPLMDRAPHLKVISNHGVGVDHIDVAAARERKIPVGNTPGCLDASTADMTMALLLATARNVVVGDRFARSPEFTHYDPSQLIGYEVSGSTLGIVGLGRIGRQVARRARAFDMTVLYFNRRRDEAAEKELGVTYVEFDDLLKQSDFVSLNCPLTPETTNLIGLHPLLGLSNVVITPHLGSASNRTRQRMIEMTVENLNAGLKGSPLSWSV